VNLLFDEEETMTRARFGSWIFGVALLLLFVSKSVTAIGPAAILLHGEGLQAPVVVRPQIGSIVFMWGGGTRYDNQSGVRMLTPSETAVLVAAGVLPTPPLP